MFLDLISIIGVCQSCISAESSTVSTLVKLDFHFPTHYLSSTLRRVTAAIFTFRPKRLTITIPREMEQLDVRIVHIQITSPCLFNLIMKTSQAKLIHQWLMNKNNHFWKPSCFFNAFVYRPSVHSTGQISNNIWQSESVISAGGCDCSEEPGGD